MYQDPQEKGRGPAAWVYRTAVLLIAVLLLISTAVGSTAAFLVTKTDPVVEGFAYAQVSCQVTDTLAVQNTGTAQAYIRASYAVNWRDREENIVAAVPEDYSCDLVKDPQGAWVEGGDGYFYYPAPVDPGGETPSLLTFSVSRPENPEYTLSVEVVAEAIQSNPAEAAEEAWGVTVSDGKLTVQ
jgi:hypothetical protein